MASKAELNSQASQLAERIVALMRSLDIDAMRSQLQKLLAQSQEPGFWDDRAHAQATLKKQDRLQKSVQSLEQAERDCQDIQEFLEVVEGEADPLLAELADKLAQLESRVSQLEFHRMFRHEADPNNAILSINSGAGGTEAQDWVAMLLRLYLRWCDRYRMKPQVVDALAGEEAGYKSVVVSVEGDYAYGYLKAENGIHRLVRISPFDANARRHTSFASVFVIPEVSQDIEIDVRDSDLRIDTYRASGAGGQHVNKTDSAVRITHLPTGIVVQCQNERSQHKNKAMCMKILKAKLYERELKEREAALDKMHGEKKEIAWGSQIRSYTLHPYRLVKDHRTKLEIGNVDAVLDGDIMPFIEAFLLQQDKVETKDVDHGNSNNK